MRISGVVETISDNHISGWVAVEPAKKRTVVYLEVNGKIVASCFANIFRQDLIAKANGGHLGFAFENFNIFEEALCIENIAVYVEAQEENFQVPIYRNTRIQLPRSA